jgi:flagellar biosynthesis chaperone FliJ
MCGKRNLSLIRYDDHMTSYHDVCLQKPVLEEYHIARSNWIVDREQANQADLETITCDYDSELEMRYSDMEYENDSGTDDNTNDSSEDDSDNFSRTDSSSESEEDQSSTESDSSSETEEQSKPRTVNSPPCDQLNEIEEGIERNYEMADALEDNYKVRTKNLNKLEENLTNLSTSLKKNKEDSAKLKSHVQKLLSAKSDTDSTSTCKTLIKTLDNMIQKETDERIKFTKKIEERFSNLESEIKVERLKLANPIITHDLEVAVNAKTQIEDKHDKNAPSSVVNFIQKPKPETDIHQLSTTPTEVKSEVKFNHNNLKLINSIEMETSEIKSEKIPNIEDIPELENEKDNDEEIEEFDAGEFFIENFFKLLTLVTMQTFKILNMAVDLNLGWGLLIIFFFLVNSAKAAPMGNEISETLEINAKITGPFSFMNEGMTTVVYGATAAITKNYILPLGNIEEDDKQSPS